MPMREKRASENSYFAAIDACARSLFQRSLSSAR
jgi:hypothetical protein